MLVFVSRFRASRLIGFWVLQVPGLRRFPCSMWYSDRWLKITQEHGLRSTLRPSCRLGGYYFYSSPASGCKLLNAGCRDEGLGKIVATGTVPLQVAGQTSLRGSGSRFCAVGGSETAFSRIMDVWV